ncbi:MAG: hypothetical protein U9R69_03680 [Thermodesulfobacteriota bacterium]|nr:hypothetical protein [Thermodesulfobacteriota bacterium]
MNPSMGLVVAIRGDKHPRHGSRKPFSQGAEPLRLIFTGKLELW